MSNVLWIPAQALQESDGRTFVYTLKETGFSTTDVKLVRRGESKVVVSGIAEGMEIALAAPDKQKQEKKGSTSGAGQAMPKKS
jgi:hypothetical protein